ncbi:Ger(x)C family spore germination protein [Paenibacillus caui]|uniref:Ger(x)C family spore germination protein n=1 Tax=Paenibacillus caui TaxID=2873927 RepID=UPI001CA86AFD|nr:Ger(x)C family spore germination protein [Paenibacillus caui]
MKRPVSKWLLCLLMFCTSIVCLTGCWDRQEIESRALILGMAIDEAPPSEQNSDAHSTHLSTPPSVKNKLIRLTAQIAVPGRVPLGPGTGGTGGGGAGDSASMPVWVVQVVGHTLDDALNNLQQEIADPKTLIHLRIIIVSEAIARQGLDDINDYLRRNPEVRRSTWLLVSDVEAAKFMNVAPPLERVPTLYLLGMIEKSTEMGKFPGDDIGQYWSDQSKWGQNAFLPHISIRGENNILIRGLAYFRDNRMIGATKPIEIGVYMAIKGMDPAGYSALLQVPPLGIVMTSTMARESKINVKIRDGKPAATLKIHLEARLVEKEAEHVKVSSPESLRLVEERLSSIVKESAENLLTRLQKDKSDIVGFGEYVRAYKSSFWRNNIHEKSDWEDLFSRMPIEVVVDSSVRRIGLKND